MKKYITSAAILATGTTLSIAGTVDWDANTQSYNITAESWKKEGSATYYTVSLGGNGFDCSLENWKIEFTFNAKPSVASNHWGSCPIASGTDPFADSYSSGFQAYIKVGGDIALKGEGISEQTITNISNKDVVKSYTYSLERSGATTTYSVYVADTTTPTEKTLLKTVTTTSSGWSTVKFTQLVTSLTETQLSDTNGWTFATGSLQVIPEPSAFGLLAGLGALALVGARRRRVK